MANLITSSILKEGLGITDDNIQLIEFDKRYSSQSKNKGKFQPLSNYLKVGVTEESESPIYLGVLKPSGEVSTLTEYQKVQVKKARSELDAIAREKLNLENDIKQMHIEMDKLNTECWLIRDDFCTVAAEVDEIEELRDTLRKKWKKEKRKFQRKVRYEIQQMSFFDKIKFLLQKE